MRRRSCSRTRAEEELVRARWVSCAMRGAAFATDE